MIECEEELQFELSGLVAGTTPRARESMKVLNLGDTRKFNKGLIEERKSMIDDLLYSKGVNPAEFIVEEDGMLDLLIEDMLRVNVQGELQAFSPVLVNVIRRLKALRVS